MSRCGTAALEAETGGGAVSSGIAAPCDVRDPKRVVQPTRRAGGRHSVPQQRQVGEGKEPEDPRTVLGKSPVADLGEAP